MHGYIARILEKELKSALRRSPVVTLLGPRQSGKSTLAKKLIANLPSVYLDLQDRTDLNKLNEPELFFERHRDELVCLDEIQRVPEFFGFLRSEVDKDRKPGRFLLLGSASRDLIRQTTETLAGRIAFVDLTPFIYDEVLIDRSIDTYWLRGGFPESMLASNDHDSFKWREDFIRTFLERDIPALGREIPVPLMERLWRLLAHYHGQTINLSKVAEAVNVSQVTLKKYIAILEHSYMLRLLQPMETNLKKRLVKSPKIYIRDSGILHTLLDIEDYDELLAHPVMGASWEGLAIENIIALFPGWLPSFIRTSNGAEVDLVLERKGKTMIFEFKASKAPKVSKGFFEIKKALSPEASYVIAPIDEKYEYKQDVFVANISKNDLTP